MFEFLSLVFGTCTSAHAEGGYSVGLLAVVLLSVLFALYESSCPKQGFCVSAHRQFCQACLLAGKEVCLLLAVILARYEL